MIIVKLFLDVITVFGVGIITLSAFLYVIALIITLVVGSELDGSFYGILLIVAILWLPYSTFIVLADYYEQ